MKAAAMQVERGFTILELMVATAIFLVLCAAMFGLLQVSQQKYSNETQLSGAFQETRLAVDQIVRDFNVAGYPGLSLFSKVPGDSSRYAIGPVAWDPNYPDPALACAIGTGGGGTCQTPGDFDLIVETDLGSGVSWIRYQLIGTTLYRSVVPKTSGADPRLATSTPNVMVPFLTNVMNNSTAQIPQIVAQYPAMFPGGGPQPIFKYTCDTPAGPQLCATAPGSSGVPNNIRDVDITLIVMTRQPDLQTQRLELVELNGRGHRVNPSN
jgi:prepilin-type N-terminal cleavage/methylation domain-containing protein